MRGRWSGSWIGSWRGSLRGSWRWDDVRNDIHLFSCHPISKLSKLASVKKVRGGARVYIKVAGSQSLKVCVGARVYIERARVYITNQK